MAIHPDSETIGRQQEQQRHQEFSTAIRALLMTPLMSPGHPEFAAVRRQAEPLRDWFMRETGWALHVEREGARLYKRPADLADTSRGLPHYDRRRYTLLCLACAVLERAEPQITLRVLGEQLLELAAEPALVATGFTFVLTAQHERRELVTVCRTLLELGVLLRVAGDEEGFVRGMSETADALYDVHRRTLAGMLAVVRGPSTWPEDAAPRTLHDRLHALVDEHVADSEEGQRLALRYQLARRLLDDPVIYTDSLETDARGYFINQRGAMAARLCTAAGLDAEQRAEGLALVDETGYLTDIAMPAEGTEAHATLLVADFMTGGKRSRGPGIAALDSLAPRAANDVIDFLRNAKDHYGKFWRKSAREEGGEIELTEIAIDRLEKLQLIFHDGERIIPRPALWRFALGDPEVRLAGAAVQAQLVRSG